MIAGRTSRKPEVGKVVEDPLVDIAARRKFIGFAYILPLDWNLDIHKTAVIE